MDFVVAGLGFGALVVVIGFALRDIGPLFHRTSGLLSPEDRAAEQLRWNGLCHSIGGVLGKAGGVVILVTVIAIVAGVSDSIGLLSVLISSIVVIGASGALILQSIRGFSRSSQPPILSHSVQTVGSTTPPETDRVPLPIAKKVDAVLNSPPERELAVVVAAIPNLPDEPNEVPVETEPPATHLVEPPVTPVPVIPRSADPIAPPPVIWDIRSTAFKSSILADIGQPETPLSGEGFASQNLSDVPSEPLGESFTSPLLENLDDLDSADVQPIEPRAGNDIDQGDPPLSHPDEVSSIDGTHPVVISANPVSEEPGSSDDETGSGEDAVIEVRHSGLT